MSDQEPKLLKDDLFDKINRFIDLCGLNAQAYLATVYIAMNKGKEEKQDEAFDRHAVNYYGGAMRAQLLNERTIHRVKEAAMRVGLMDTKGAAQIEHRSTLHEVLGEHFSQPERRAAVARLQKYQDEPRSGVPVHLGGRRTPPEQTRRGESGWAGREDE